MPRYNLNNEDVDIILDALQNYLLNTNFEHRPNQISSLKKRLLEKIKTDQRFLDDDLDPWKAFNGA